MKDILNKVQMEIENDFYKKLFVFMLRSIPPLGQAEMILKWSLESQNKFWMMVFQDMELFKTLPLEMHMMRMVKKTDRQEDLWIISNLRKMQERNWTEEDMRIEEKKETERLEEDLDLDDKMGKEEKESNRLEEELESEDRPE